MEPALHRDQRGDCGDFAQGRRSTRANQRHLQRNRPFSIQTDTSACVRPGLPSSRMGNSSRCLFVRDGREICACERTPASGGCICSIGEEMQEGPIPYLVLVGDGPERAVLEAKVREHGLEERVRFGGFRQDIPACLHACDAFVHSSLYEGLGYTIIEAMASEVPVVASHVGGVKEFVTHKQTGLAVSPGDVAGLTEAMKTICNRRICGSGSSTMP